jgi:hypothetical protein
MEKKEKGKTTILGHGTGIRPIPLFLSCARWATPQPHCHCTDVGPARQELRHTKLLLPSLIPGPARQPLNLCRPPGGSLLVTYM